MPAEIPCPHCGLPVPKPGGSWRLTEEATAEQAAAEDAEVSSMNLLGSGSNDDSFAASPFGQQGMAAEPDPILGTFAARQPRSAPTPGTGDLFSAIDLSASPPTPARSARADSGSFDDEDERPRGSKSWTVVLLGSYASALTLALAWSLISQRSRDRADADKATVEDSRVDPGQQAGLSRKVEPSGPIAADRVVGLGKTLKLGSLEVTPVEVKRRDVTLQRTTLDGKSQRKEGGKGAFVLTLRLRNTSTDTIYAPLDQAFVRERDRQIVDSYIETVDGGRIYPFPLAVESEWSIVGQDFAELRPGESRVVALASVADAPGEDRGPFVWRVRLRTGVERTEVIGVRWPSKS